ncbi:unnamed protein product [Rangifer tarandus platyrhynchus]|uniref:Uncharacterized protein n=1 Tax=Rangifer tarandus platyrhynchus TaxID=3082113 RepID=A0AC59Z1E3_RANTA
MLVMSESRVNARRGGRQEGSQIVKLCVGRARAALALPGARRPERAAPQARAGPPRVLGGDGESARPPPGARRAPACARRRARAVRCARRRPGARAELGLAGRGRREGRARDAGGRRANPRVAVPLTSPLLPARTSRERGCLRLGGLCTCSSQRRCRRGLTAPGRPGPGCGAREGDPRGWGRNCRTRDSQRRARLAGSLSSGPCSAHWDGLLASIERRCFQDGALGNWYSVSAGGQGSAGAVGRRCLFALAPSRLFGLPGSIAAVFPETGKENCRDLKAYI